MSDTSIIELSYAHMERSPLNVRSYLGPKISPDRMAAAEIANHRKFQLISHDCPMGYFRKKSLRIMKQDQQLCTCMIWSGQSMEEITTCFCKPKELA